MNNEVKTKKKLIEQLIPSRLESSETLLNVVKMGFSKLVPQEHLDDVLLVVQSDYLSSLVKLREEYISELYEKTFTSSELADVLIFKKSSAGEKLSGLTMDVLKAGDTIASTFFTDDIMDDIMKKISSRGGKFSRN